MKKFISFALIAAMAVTTLVGCGNKGAKADGGSSDAAITVMSREDGSHKAEGNGLGLALVKRIVDSAGGTIKAENREYGGCRFVVELPIQKDEAI